MPERTCFVGRAPCSSPTLLLPINEQLVATSLGQRWPQVRPLGRSRFRILCDEVFVDRGPLSLRRGAQHLAPYSGECGWDLVTSALP